ncbi:PepSY domain-containing protein [Neisseria sp. CP9]|jgi:hypothetical periplasmic protein|uniref:PepSY domain-containing protein n=1 Tax=Neisseria TaxID=482 RepID=UPI0006675136|nr:MULTISPECIES: PepSY domain-containing protein [Neisseria]OFN27093.1 peptidase propeptide and YPEB domain protein [Neisseria sp. HMSC077D05]OFT24721.1 peptidase propeptide and YPEB domain protein [Neisseria sp. HMSC03D10]RKV83619.1 MAG: PepSY domain-containing protein [Neisseria sp.]
MKKLLLTAIVALSAAVAGANDYIEHQIYSDRNFEQNRTKAIRMLEQRGYRVHDIDADDYRGRPVLDVEAYKGGREYDIKLSYPDLRIIKERIDY